MCRKCPDSEKESSAQGGARLSTIFSVSNREGDGVRHYKTLAQASFGSVAWAPKFWTKIFSLFETGPPFTRLQRSAMQRGMSAKCPKHTLSAKLRGPPSVLLDALLCSFAKSPRPSLPTSWLLDGRIRIINFSYSHSETLQRGVSHSAM